jgi:hypothetical protein
MRKHKKLIFLALLLVILCVATGAFFISSSRPDKLTEAQKEKAIADILGRKPNIEVKEITGNKTYEGKYITFQYPAKAVIYEYKEPVENDINSETFSFDIESPRLILNYAGEANRSDLNALEDIPAVRLRQDAANGYKASKIEADGAQGVAFFKAASGEFRADKTAFFLIGKTSYSISISGGDEREIDKLLNQILSSADFK